MTISGRILLLGAALFLGIGAIGSQPAMAGSKCEAECNRLGAKCANQSNQNCRQKTIECKAGCR